MNVVRLAQCADLPAPVALPSLEPACGHVSASAGTRSGHALPRLFHVALVEFGLEFRRCEVREREAEVRQIALRIDPHTGFAMERLLDEDDAEFRYTREPIIPTMTPSS